MMKLRYGRGSSGWMERRRELLIKVVLHNIERFKVKTSQNMKLPSLIYFRIIQMMRRHLSGPLKLEGDCRSMEFQ
ncbi:hypothetical protein KAU11_12705, partial [Candidatus Babeliales bacterium]|nr:hypothetical protein [Candidatus Babeliales bacterium]